MRLLLFPCLLLLTSPLHAEPAAVPLESDAAEKAADPLMGTAAGWTVRLDLDGFFPAG